MISLLPAFAVCHGLPQTVQGVKRKMSLCCRFRRTLKPTCKARLHRSHSAFADHGTRLKMVLLQKWQIFVSNTQQALLFPASLQTSCSGGFGLVPQMSVTQIECVKNTPIRTLRALEPSSGDYSATSPGVYLWDVTIKCGWEQVVSNLDVQICEARETTEKRLVR